MTSDRSSRDPEPGAGGATLRKVLVWTFVGLASLFFAVPLGLRHAGDRAMMGIDWDPENPTAYEQSYRLAMALHGGSRICPLYWRSAADRRDRSRELLLNTYRTVVFFGHESPRTAEREIAFLRSLAEEDDRWQSDLVMRLAAYGRYREALAEAPSHPEPLAVEALAASALATGDREAFSAWYPRMDEEGELFRYEASLWLVSGRNDDLVSWVDAHPGALAEEDVLRAEAWRRAGRVEEARAMLRPLVEVDDVMIQPLATQVFALALAGGDAASEDIDLLERALHETPAPSTAYLCSWLALASVQVENGRERRAAGSARRAAEAAEDGFGSFFPLYRLATHWFDARCPPESFEPAREALSEEIDLLTALHAVEDDPDGPVDEDLAMAEAIWRMREELAVLTVVQAATHLRVMDPDPALALLDEAEALGVPLVQIPYHRVVAMESRGRWDEALRIAREDLDGAPVVREHVVARVTLESGDIEAARPLVEALPVSTEPVYSFAEEVEEMRAVVARADEKPLESWQMSGFDASFLDSDPQFRNWFTELLSHPGNPQIAHQFAIPVLRRWQSADEEGAFLVAYHRFEGVSLNGALVRAHLGYLEALARGDDEAASARWKDVEAVRAIWLAEPVWPFLSPTLFILG